jgi:phospholipid/cholesterol/gamma-HCH transport system ATP-binding protein
VVTTSKDEAPVVTMRNVSTSFGTHVVHSCVDLTVRRAEIFAIVGGSGSGKSTLLREMILLQRPDSGTIRVLDVDLENLGRAEELALRKRFGVMFQHGGMFGALTVLENIGLPLREHTSLDDTLIDDLATLRLAATGLSQDVGAQFPAELSGGMMKRVSLARALVLDPELLFLDEPTAGLDPESADGVDSLIRDLRDLTGLTVIMVTHDLDLLWQVADRVAVLNDGRVLTVGTMHALAASEDPTIQRFFFGRRGRAAEDQDERARAVGASLPHGSTPSKPR